MGVFVTPAGDSVFFTFSAAAISFAIERGLERGSLWYFAMKPFAMKSAIASSQQREPSLRSYAHDSSCTFPVVNAATVACVAV